VVFGSILTFPISALPGMWIVGVELSLAFAEKMLLYLREIVHQASLVNFCLVFLETM
jgi:hypothetical protein